MKYMDLEGRIESLLGGRRDIIKRLRAHERESDNSRDIA